MYSLSISVSALLDDARSEVKNRVVGSEGLEAASFFGVAVGLMLFTGFATFSNKDTEVVGVDFASVS